LVDFAKRISPAATFARRSGPRSRSGSAKPRRSFAGRRPL